MNDGDHPTCPSCGSDQTDVITDPIGVEPTRAECWACGNEWGEPNLEERIVIYANSNTSRGKYAAAAVHAALTAAGVHPGLPVIVLGAKSEDIEKCATVIHDAGRTEVTPGTTTAGTNWKPGE